MKKILKISLLVLIICLVAIGSSYALSCNASLQSAKTSYEKGEEFTIDFTISNIESDRGVISLSATLEYDKDSLTLVDMEGQNKWETPSEGASYNSANGKIAITRNGVGKNDEVVFKMTFKVNDEAKQNFAASLKNIALADGTATHKIEEIKKDFTLKTTINQPNLNETNTSGSTDFSNMIDSTNTTNITSGTNTSNTLNKSNTAKNQATISSDNSTSGSNLPKTGVNSTVLIVVGLIVAVMATYFGIKMKSTKN